MLDFQKFITESVEVLNGSSLSPQEKENFYQQFKDSYIKATGQAWSPELFYKRLYNWNLYTNPERSAFIAVRPQRSGLYKLTGVAGSPLSTARIMKHLLSLHLPLWGMVSDEIAQKLKNLGMIVPPQSLIMKVANYIPFLNKDINIAEIGTVEKTFVGTPEYFNWLKNDENSPIQTLNPVNKLAVKGILNLLK